MGLRGNASSFCRWRNRGPWRWEGSLWNTQHTHHLARTKARTGKPLLPLPNCTCFHAFLPRGLAALPAGWDPPAHPGNTSFPRLALTAAPGQGWTGLIWGRPGTWNGARVEMVIVWIYWVKLKAFPFSFLLLFPFTFFKCGYWET